MNQVLHAGAATVQHGWLLGLTTVVFLVCFAGWTWWAFSARNAQRHNEAALLPLTSEDEP